MTGPAVSRIPDPPDPPDKTCFNEVELSIWRMGWTFGYIAAQDARIADHNPGEGGA